MAGRAPAIAISGPGQTTDDAVLSAAREASRLLAEAGAVVISGGGGGVMHQASIGARAGGGAPVAILASEDPRDVHEEAAIVVATGAGQARNVIIVNSCLALIVVGESHGTLVEVALALRAGKPVVGLNRSYARLYGAIRQADAPGEAVELALTAVREGRESA